MNQEALLSALQEAQSALELIACPVRPDGTYNRDRRACEQLARDALTRIGRTLNPAPVEPVLVANGGPFIVYSDGGCKGNPGPAGWGIVLVEAGEVRAAAGGYIGSQTNQIAELVAAIEGLTRTPEGAVVELVSDSQYTLKGISEWRKGWERRGWVNSANQPVANKEHWVRLFALVDRRQVTTRWVKGHSGDVHNERCDELATQAIEQRATLILG